MANASIRREVERLRQEIAARRTASLGASDPEQARLDAFLASEAFKAMLCDTATPLGRRMLALAEWIRLALGLGSIHDRAPPGAVDEAHRRLAREDDAFLADHWRLMQELSAACAAHGHTLDPRQALARLTGLPAEELGRRLAWEPAPQVGAGGPAPVAAAPAAAAAEIVTPPSVTPPAPQLLYGLREMPPEPPPGPAPEGFTWEWEDDSDGLEVEASEQAGEEGRAVGR
jgi:hypothetical protein